MNHEIKKIQAILSPLLCDVIEVEKLVRSNANQALRRCYLRSVFALVEGLCFQIRQTCRNSPYNQCLSSTELAKLGEGLWIVDEQGGTKRRTQYLKTSDGVKLAVNSFAKCLGISYRLDPKTEGWRAFLRAIQIRHDCTHPKSADSLHITDNDLKELHLAEDWFRQQLFEIIPRRKKS